MEENKKQLEEEIEKELKKYKSSNLPHTRNYLIERLREDPDFNASKGMFLKEDLIDLFFETRKEKGIVPPDYDFSNVPKIINDRHSKFTLKYRDKNGNIKDYTTEFGYFIGRSNDIKGYYIPNKSNTEDFIKKAKEIFGDRYGYDESEYINEITKLKIYCKDCNEFFWQTPHSHLSGCGCTICGNKLSSMLKKKNTNTFIKESKTKFGENKFDYSDVIYDGCNKAIQLKCNDCGSIFLITPNNHLSSKYGCPNCSRIEVGLNSRLTQEEFITRAQIALGDTYDFSESKYKGLTKEVTVYDKQLKEYFSKKAVYLFHGIGNSNRKTITSIGENEIKKALNGLGIPFKSQYLVNDEEIKFELKLEDSYRTKVILDFFIEYNGEVYIIEYNGKQHYKFIPWFHKTPLNFFNQIKRDQAVSTYCMIKKYTYIEISYDVDISTIKDGLDAIINKKEAVISYFPSKLPTFEEVWEYESNQATNKGGQEDEQ